MPRNESCGHNQVRLGEKRGRDGVGWGGVGEGSTLRTASATVRHPVDKAKGSQSGGIIHLDKADV